MLFADFGKGPRVVAHRRAENRYGPDGSMFVDAAAHLAWFEHRQRHRVQKARRWWLVECQTAYHGRKVIAAQGAGLRTVGRILGSGPKP